MSPNKKIKVLVVDDSAIVRQALSQIFNSDPLIEVIATASNPYIAVNKIQCGIVAYFLVVALTEN